MKEFVFNSCPKDTYRPTHSRKSPQKRDFVVHTQKADIGTHSEYIFELRKPFIAYGIP